MATGQAGRARVFALVLVATGALAAAPLLAGDAEIHQRIETRLAKAGLHENADIRVEVEGGVARLTGVALSLPDAREAEKAARKEAKAVINLVRVFTEERTDPSIRSGVERAIVGYSRYGVFDAVGADVEKGAVVLRGWVLNPWHRDEIEVRVARVPGVRELRNEIRVQSVSPHDARLRFDLYRRIYGDIRFERYADWPNPPIRIIVDRGRVTLAGMVGSKVEQAILGSIARGTFAFAVDNQVRVEGEVEKEPARSRSVQG